MIATHTDKAIVIGFSPNCWLIPLKTENSLPFARMVYRTDVFTENFAEGF